MGLLRTILPVMGRAIFTGQFFRPQCELVEADPEVLADYDVEIPMSEGFSLTADVFRSRQAHQNGTPMPVVMCAHPYDNHLTPALGNTPFGGPPQEYRTIPQAGKPRFSTLTSFEAPDPNYWIPAGYTLVNLNMPGFGSSGGPSSIDPRFQAKCFYEAIEWVGRQQWCTGRVGLNGVSFLAASQYFVATCEEYGGAPPSLAGIVPWEGLADNYPEMICPGGVEEAGFLSFWYETSIKPVMNDSDQDFLERDGHPRDWLKRNPLYDEFWEARAPKLENISVPMMVCASFSDQGLHTVGSFRAFMEARSENKWVYTHRWGKWDSFYSREVMDLTKEFMDCFVKGDTDNGFLERAPVRLEVRSDRDTIHEVREELEWPLARTEYFKLHLDGTNRVLSPTASMEVHEVAYSGRRGEVRFKHKFEEDTELTGYMKLKLHVEARPGRPGGECPDDMTLFAAVNKLDRRGRDVRFYGCVGNKNDTVTRGLLRVSRRELDDARSTDAMPVLSLTAEKKLTAGEVVPIEIALCPSSTFFYEGESLEVIISSREIGPQAPFRKDVSQNRGLHVLHIGGDFDAYLLAPRVPRALSVS